MANLTVTIPDLQIPRIIAAYKHLLDEGEAVDLDNPTGLEIQAKLQQLVIENIKLTLERLEKKFHSTSFVFDDINIT